MVAPLNSLRANLNGLGSLVIHPGGRALASRPSLSYGPPPRVMEPQFTSGNELIKGPISRGAARGALALARAYADWMDSTMATRRAEASALDANVRAIHANVGDLQADVDSLRLRSDYVLLQTEYRMLREELDRLERQVIRDRNNRPRVGLGISGYEGRVVGVGAVARARVRNVNALAAAYGLARRSTGWDPGAELSLGVVVANVGLLPGLVLMQGERDARVQLNAGQSYLAPELHGGVAGVKSGVTNSCRMRKTTEVWASKMRVRP